VRKERTVYREERKKEGRKGLWLKRKDETKKKCGQKERKWRGKEEKQNRQRTCNVILRHLRATIFAVEKQ